MADAPAIGGPQDGERVPHERDAIDRAGRDNEALYLTKLVLLLAQRNEDAAVVTTSIEAALRDLPNQSD
jgi:hypothetical protein